MFFLRKPSSLSTSKRTIQLNNNTTPNLDGFANEAMPVLNRILLTHAQFVLAITYPVSLSAAVTICFPPFIQWHHHVYDKKHSHYLVFFMMLCKYVYDISIVYFIKQRKSKISFFISSLGNMAVLIFTILPLALIFYFSMNSSLFILMMFYLWNYSMFAIFAIFSIFPKWGKDLIVVITASFLSVHLMRILEVESIYLCTITLSLWDLILTFVPGYMAAQTQLRKCERPSVRAFNLKLSLIRQALQITPSANATKNTSNSKRSLVVQLQPTDGLEPRLSKDSQPKMMPFSFSGRFSGKFNEARRKSQQARLTRAKRIQFNNARKELATYQAYCNNRFESGIYLNLSNLIAINTTVAIVCHRNTYMAVYTSFVSICIAAFIKTILHVHSEIDFPLVFWMVGLIYLTSTCSSTFIDLYNEYNFINEIFI